MNFLVWYNPLSWLSDVGNEIMGTIVNAIRALSYQLSVVIYKIVIYLYNTFETLCNARILNDDIIKQLASRIGLILGIVMLFVVTISFIQMLLEPDNVNDKEKGAINVIKKVLIVIVMFGISNFAFNTLYQFQKVVINSNIISKFLLPNIVDTDKFGGVLAAELFVAFYDVDLVLKDNLDTSDSLINLEDGSPEFCQYLVYGLKTNIVNDYNFGLGYYCLNEYTTVNMPNANKAQQIHIIDYNILLCPIVGCVCIWMLFSYCIMVGTRIIIIAFLEIISPMAFISYLSPKKDTMFSKWLKLYVDTYLDAFIRIAIINFVVFLIATIFTYAETSTFWNSVGNPDGFTKKFIMVLIVLSLLTFAKKAPELLKNIFPSSSGSGLGFGITSPKKMFDSMLGVNEIKSFANNTVGLLGRKTIAGFDAKLHGQNFRDGWKSPKGIFGTWLGKQRETYMPNYNEVYKNRIAGAKEVEEINTKWNKGANIAKRLMDAGAGRSGTGANAWDKVLNGEAANIGYYEAIFKDDRFIRSKMQVDYNTAIEDKLRRLQQRVNLEGATKAFTGGSITIDGVTYDETNVNELVENLEKQQKKVEGLKNNHASISKQCHKDAEIEEQFKYIKNNDANPTNPTDTKATRHL